MTQKSKIPPTHYFEPQDEYEAEIMNSIEKEEWKRISKKENEKIKKELSIAAKKNSVYLRKPVSLRLKTTTIAGLKQKEAEIGFSWNAILSALADQYVAGKIKLGL